MNYLGRNIIHCVERPPRLRGYHYLSRTCLGGGARPQSTLGQGGPKVSVIGILPSVLDKEKYLRK
jgi:hypothetical protein